MKSEEIIRLMRDGALVDMSDVSDLDDRALASLTALISALTWVLEDVLDDRHFRQHGRWLDEMTKSLSDVERTLVERNSITGCGRNFWRANVD